MCSYKGPFHDYNCPECSKPVATDTGKVHGPLTIHGQIFSVKAWNLAIAKCA